MHSFKPIVFLIACTGIVSCFQPWANQLYFGQSGSASGMHFAEGPFCLVYFIIIAAICFMTGIRKAWSDRMCVGIAFTTLLPIALTCYKIYEFERLANKMRGFEVDLNAYVLYNPANGIYTSVTCLILIAAVMLVDIVFANRQIFMRGYWIKTQPSANVSVASSQ